MVATSTLERISRQQSEMPLQRQWPQLGRELFTLECAPLTDTFVTYGTPRIGQEEIERKGRIKGQILAQLYRDEEKYPRDARYRAFLGIRKELRIR